MKKMGYPIFDSPAYGMATFFPMVFPSYLSRESLSHLPRKGRKKGPRLKGVPSRVFLARRAGLPSEVREEEKPYGKKEELLSRGFILWHRERVTRLRGARLRAPIYHSGFVVCVRCNSAFFIFPFGRLDMCPFCRRKTFEIATINRFHPFNRPFHVRTLSRKKRKNLPE